ncbi:MAG: nicotinate-nucleotide adenylyltransferase [Moorella sp. (in: firmicutes)]|jgi:nicotinate-nucleotide adenylyltransferase|uniref:nicotinate-nucleotide adenylyltransferase n=1 Tax=unclassified Neomoorella TaxID=2676739 RepID=UPI0010FFBA8D|nr:MULTISPECIES: nicotinate-nucleotide adenylyltransferase [unclassified Moorella (in: firmicutes)]MDK2815761.1 nicotinate-nucleotide adenylyltransferase [Moorella sp. (in: firmicutes)]MDK2894323.1 nicotinate-nucleotide adenylyltransferase [Moorella sp. (in: firmicutes)]GEA16431.1 putative nicotinate-nucleotide adenylyltransferase [Moorella sp. E308F]GEA17391.1 putative nicotinate-nucleotide adenylyltransferase [Moorella sp. E306M]
MKTFNNNRRVGIMGGTFDPIHFGHLVTAEAARWEFALEKVVFVPSGRPPHKKDYPVTDSEHRYQMTVLATASNPYFEVSRSEIDREGYSYTIDTVLEFRRFYGPEVQLFFITGADAILEILTWKDVDRLLQECHFIAATRPGFQLSRPGESRPMLPVEGRHRIHLIEVPALAISSTDIRWRVQNKKPIKYLLPEAVEEYIHCQGLYRPRNSGVYEKS